MKITYDSQTIEALASIVRSPDAIQQLPPNIRQQLVEHPGETLAGLVRLEKLETQSKPTSQILETVITSIPFPGTKKPFVVSDHFRKDSTTIKFWDFGSNFNSWFGGMTEKPVGPSTLRVDKLTKISCDKDIIKALGGERKAETSLAEFHARLEAQGKGQSGPLLTNGYWNIFYIRDKDGVLRAVCAGWNGGRWGVGAYGLDCAGWDDGYRVVSRN